MSVTFIIHFVFWLLGLIFLFHIPLCRKGAERGSSRPTVSIIIPARNEEKTLPTLLTSLKGETDTSDETIVIDDHSEDRTKEIAERNGATVIKSKVLPKGWMGKSWACYQGAKAARGELLIFLDADTAFERDGLKKVLDTYYKFKGVLSIQPYHKMRKLYEELSSFFNLVIMAAMGAFTIFGRAIKPIGLFGPVMVLTKQEYLDSGGHAKVQGEILEDLAYGSDFKKRSIGTYCYGGRHTVSFRMYPDGIRQLINGWSKGFALGAAKTSVPVLIIIIAWITGAIGTTRHLAESVIITDTNQITIWGILYFCYALQIYWMLARIGNFKFYTALLYPIPLLFFVIVFIYSFILIFIRRRVQWKGRVLDIKGGDSNAIPSSDSHNDWD